MLLTVRDMKRLLVVAVAAIGFGGQGCGASSPATGRTCTELESDYQQALSAASSCTPGAANQCQQPVSVSFCAGCNLYVNDAASVNAVRAQIFSQGCVRCEGLELCLQSGPWACVATDGGTLGGQCAIAPTSGGQLGTSLRERPSRPSAGDPANFLPALLPGPRAIMGPP
jgi:hypothetical protein